MSDAVNNNLQQEGWKKAWNRVRQLPSSTLISAPSWMEHSFVWLSSGTSPSRREKHVRWQVISCSISTWCSSPTSIWPETWSQRGEGISLHDCVYIYDWVQMLRIPTWSSKLSTAGGWILTLKVEFGGSDKSWMLWSTHWWRLSFLLSSVSLRGADDNRKKRRR